MANKTIQTQKENQPIKVGSLQEAKEKIFSEIQNGSNYRNIAKMKFDIEDTVRSFNISQISQIKAEFEPKKQVNSNDSDRAKVFKLFKKGLSPADVLIKTGFGFEFIKQCRKEYNEFADKMDVPRSFIQRLQKILDPHFRTDTFRAIEQGVEETVFAYKEMLGYTYNCSVCGEEEVMGDQELRAMKKYLSKNWAHKSCIDKIKQRKFKAK